jgi:hypothetical protein
MDLSRRPLRIALIRHGESEANLDKTIFEARPGPRDPADAARARAGGQGRQGPAGAVRGRSRSACTSRRTCEPGRRWTRSVWTI